MYTKVYIKIVCKIAYKIVIELYYFVTDFKHNPETKCYNFISIGVFFFWGGKCLGVLFSYLMETCQFPPQPSLTYHSNQMGILIVRQTLYCISQICVEVLLCEKLHSYENTHLKSKKNVRTCSLYSSICRHLH